MHSNYQVTETHYANLALTIHSRIDDLHRRAEKLAPRIAEDTAEAGATNLTVREHVQLAWVVSVSRLRSITDVRRGDLGHGRAYGELHRERAAPVDGDPRIVVVRRGGLGAGCGPAGGV